MVDETKRILSAGKKRLLIIEDDLSIQTTLRVRLEANGYGVLSAADGADALFLVRQHKPDLIILDLILPTLDGYDVCHFLKSDHRYRHIRILMLTARVQRDDEERGWRIGADAYMKKPFESAELVATVRRLLLEK